MRFLDNFLLFSHYNSCFLQIGVFNLGAILIIHIYHYINIFSDISILCFHQAEEYVSHVANMYIQLFWYRLYLMGV